MTTTSPAFGPSTRGESSAPATRLLVVTESFQVGGAETQALQVIQHLPPMAFEVEFALLGAGGPLEEDVRQLGLPVHRIFRGYGLHAVTLYELARVLARGRFDVVEGLLHYSGMMAGAAGWLARTPVRIASNVGDRTLYADDFRARKQRLVKGLSYRFCNRIFVNSGFVIASDPQLRGHRHKVHMIHNGLKEEFFQRPCGRAEALAELGLPAESLVVSMVGRLVPSKDHESFLAVIADLVPQFPTLRALIVGDGPHREFLTSAAARAGIADRVTFTGTVRDPRRILAGTDVFLFTSRRESLPNAVLEAMAQGVPVVAVDTAGVPELIEDGIYGRLVQPGDVRAMSDAVRNLLVDPDRRAQWGAAARQAAEGRFHWDRRIGDFVRLFTP